MTSDQSIDQFRTEWWNCYKCNNVSRLITDKRDERGIMFLPKSVFFVRVVMKIVELNSQISSQ